VKFHIISSALAFIARIILYSSAVLRVFYNSI